MKTHLIVTATAIAFASSVSVASAAEQGSTMSKTSQPSAMHEMTKPGLSLTTAQQKLAWKDIGRTAAAQKAPADFTPRVGAAVPNDVALKPVPADLGRRVSALKPYDYALLKRDLLIVNPGDKKVVDVINRHA
jgi:Protein of unknown function (DUF1236)